jgi:peptidase M1-like protein
MNRINSSLLFRAVAVFACAALAGTFAHSQAPANSSGAVWSAMSAPAMDASKSAHVQNLSFTRDAVHITLADGTIQFAQPVNGVTFAAVFHGSGRVEATPPNPIEHHQLRLFTKQDKLDLNFIDATFSFTDNFAEEIAKQVKWQAGAATDELYTNRQREREDLGAEYLPRLFKSVMSPDRQRTAYFLADLKTKEKGWVEVRYDALQPEEVRIGRWADVGPFKLYDTWMSFPAGGRDPRHAFDDPAAREDYLIPSYQITINLADNAELNATAQLTVQPRYSGERVLLFSLDSNLRVGSVKDAQGNALEFFQPRERKDRNQSYGNYVAVVLKNADKTNRNEVLTFQYGGKHVVIKVGGGNYFCQSFGWYPSFFSDELGVDEFAFRSNFDLTFRAPKKYGLVATGSKTSATIDGKESITNWKSEVPLAAAGFAFGDYKVTSEKVGDIEVQVYTNRQPDDLLAALQSHFDNSIDDLAAGPGGLGMGRHMDSAVGSFNASGLSKTITQETANTLRVFQNYFGPYPYKQIAVTNIIGDYGQGWPGLLYLGWFTFLDSTQQHELGMKNQVGLTDFFRGHESSHQWWGHRVGWKSYHDQWLSEGFAEFSGKLYVQFRQNQKEFLEQFRRDKELLHTGDQKNHAIESLGPIWMGYRIRSSETNRRSYQDLIYSKGGYVLQMLREQLADPRNPDPDHLFKDMMQDYCKTFDNKPASTEDFKTIVEKHMLRNMDLDGNHKMDWFFNQYVYGIGMPSYNFHATLEPAADGKTHVKAELARSGVAEPWKDVVPLYAHAGDKTFRLGSLAATHATESVDITLPMKVDRVSINDHEDLLAEVKQ